MPSVPGITGSLLTADGPPAGSAGAQVVRPQGPLLRRRGAVTPRALAGRGAQSGAPIGTTGATRAGPASMDAVAAGYTHIRRDLIRILVLALVMLAIIVVLSFVLQ